jgi:signal transduction histidine kinase
VLAAADEERRRLVRDLHDGAQQRLVHAAVTLKLAHRSLQREETAAEEALVGEAIQQTDQATTELRELVRGILPSVLTRGGLKAAVEALASRAPLPVTADISVGRLPSAIEATAYFLVAEALTNVAKHSRARSAQVMAALDCDLVRVEVRDNGVGGARPEGTGLLGLEDRLATLDGQLQVESAPGGGTVVAADIPLPA